MDEHLFLNGFIYLVAAALAAPLGRRLGVGAVLGYLIIGAIIGPSAFGWVGENREEVMHFGGAVIGPFALGWVGGTQGEEAMHFAEFGVVLMLS